ncbi:PilT/PilU family type 4a pilus ATPase [uncultured Ilyobacter sp.]|uniref:type IV pilus twitching motility protein PilT n=1 Tax=uncultured Ilyobacter sp. TaxID=544433 RepID=UPI0029F47D0E|nr:PilT/PilU family type 4a pilus ATPase [uncultured Ilyobacter sp.]
MDLLHQAAERSASDVHLVPGYSPTFRIHGKLESSGAQLLVAEDLDRLVAELMPERAGTELVERRGGDSAISIEHKGNTCRFRANVYMSQGAWCACLRHIPNVIPTFDWLGFPKDLGKRLVSYSNGLVVITGVTGSGKSATLASLMAYLRRGGTHHILTIEEPIEYIHSPGQGGIVTQREVGRDVDSFADGLKFGLRQDPDAILVGEIRDRDTAQIAISAAETGHLIFTTLHTRDAKGALTRLVDVFPHDSQDDVRGQLAMSLRSIVSQHLLPPAVEGDKRILALEVMHNTSQVAAAIRTGKIETLESAIQTGKRDGMVMLDDDLVRLVTEGKITIETARRYAKDPENIKGPSKAW